MSSQSVTYSGLSLGAALAMIISYDLCPSILWTIFHGFLGWFYVIYHAFFK